VPKWSREPMRPPQREVLQQKTTMLPRPPGRQVPPGRQDPSSPLLEDVPQRKAKRPPEETWLLHPPQPLRQEAMRSPIQTRRSAADPWLLLAPRAVAEEEG